MFRPNYHWFWFSSVTLGTRTGEVWVCRVLTVIYSVHSTMLQISTPIWIMVRMRRILSKCISLFESTVARIRLVPSGRVMIFGQQIFAFRCLIAFPFLNTYYILYKQKDNHYVYEDELLLLRSNRSHFCILLLVRLPCLMIVDADSRTRSTGKFWWRYPMCSIV